MVFRSSSPNVLKNQVSRVGIHNRKWFAKFWASNNFRASSKLKSGLVFFNVLCAHSETYLPLWVEDNRNHQITVEKGLLGYSFLDLLDNARPNTRSKKVYKLLIKPLLRRTSITDVSCSTLPPPIHKQTFRYWIEMKRQCSKPTQRFLRSFRTHDWVDFCYSVGRQLSQTWYKTLFKTYISSVARSTVAYETFFYHVEQFHITLHNGSFSRRRSAVKILVLMSISFVESTQQKKSRSS